MKKIKNIIKNWRKIIFVILILWIVYLNIKVHYLEYLNSNQYHYDNYQESELDAADNHQESESDVADNYQESESDVADNYQESESDVADNYQESESDEIIQLKNKIEAYEALIKIKKDSTEILFNDIFWDIGKYVPENKNAKIFFASPGCEKSDIVKPNWFLSKRWISYDRFNSNWVYSYLTDKGYVWTNSEISFVEYKKK